MDFDLPFWDSTVKLDLPVVLDDGAYMPVRAHETDAGLDLRTPNDFTLFAGSSKVIDTFVRVAIPEGYFGKLESKSGLHILHDIVCLGGVIDSSYIGTIRVKLHNFGDKDYEFTAGDKIVQMIIQPCAGTQLILKDKLDDTERGEGGFGSSGR